MSCAVSAEEAEDDEGGLLELRWIDFGAAIVIHRCIYSSLEFHGGVLLN